MLQLERSVIWNRDAVSDYERQLYKAEISRLKAEVKRLTVLLRMWREAAMMDYAKVVEVPSGPNEQAEGRTRRA